MAKSFRELKVWNKSMDLSLVVYKLTSSFPPSEWYGLSSPMRGVAASIPSNVAEGAARSTPKDFKHFSTLARGSNNEPQTQLVLSERLGYAPPADINDGETLSHEIGQMLSGLSKYLNTPKSN